MKPPFDLDENDLADVRVGVEVRSKRGRRDLGLVDVVTATLETNSDQPVPERLSLEAPPEFLPVNEWSLLAADGQQLHVASLIEVRGRVFRVEHGAFLIQSWEEDASGKISVSAHGLLQTVVDAPWAYATSPAAWATLQVEAQRLAFPLPVTLSKRLGDTRLPKGLSWGRDRLDALTDLGEAMGLRWLVRNDNSLHAVPYRSGKDVAAAYSDSVLLLGSQAQGDHETPNRVTVWGRARENDEQSPVHSHTASTRMGRFDPKFYGTVGIVEELEAGTTPSVVSSVANRKLGEAQRAVGEFSVEMVCDPRLELYDVISVKVEGVTRVVEVTGFSMPLTHEGSMSVKVRELSW